MIVDLYNELFTMLDDAGLNVLRESPDPTGGSPTFPCVVFVEANNTSDEDNTRDSNGEQYRVLHYELQIYATGLQRRTTAIGIRNTIDAMFADDLGMQCSFSSEIPNYADRNVFRYGLRYECKADENKTIYRR